MKLTTPAKSSFFSLSAAASRLVGAIHGASVARGEGQQGVSAMRDGRGKLRSIMVAAGMAAALLLAASPLTAELLTKLTKGPAPAFQARLLKGDGSVSLSDLKGKVVLLNFWASWCAPCRYEMPHFQELHDRFKDDGLAVVAVAVWDKRAEALAFVEKHKFNFTTLFDDDGKVAKTYKLVGPPLTFIVDRDGSFVSIPDPKTGEKSLSVYDPTIWTNKKTFEFIETLLKP